MQLVRSGIALDPRRFGRAQTCATTPHTSKTSVADDLRLFAVTFMAGFVFVSILLA